MRKILIVVVLLMLTGCGVKPVYETVSDRTDDAITVSPPGTMELELPEDAAVEVMVQGNGRCVLTKWGEVRLQTLPGGDIAATFREITGVEAAHIEHIQIPGQRYEAVWTTASEEGLLTARTAVWDDGRYHYCLTLLKPEEEGASLGADYQSICSTLSLRYTEQ